MQSHYYKKIKRIWDIACILVLVTMSSWTGARGEDLDRGHSLLLEKGIQLQGLYVGDFGEWNSGVSTLFDDAN